LSSSQFDPNRTTCDLLFAELSLSTMRRASANDPPSDARLQSGVTSALERNLPSGDRIGSPGASGTVVRLLSFVVNPRMEDRYVGPEMFVWIFR
jgi:hypothetical protein